MDLNLVGLSLGLKKPKTGLPFKEKLRVEVGIVLSHVFSLPYYPSGSWNVSELISTFLLRW